MTENIRASVALASFNGENFIERQIRTILDDMGPSDELVVSDDGSTDRTREIVQSFNDPRIRLVGGPCKGIKQNFAHAIEESTGRYIFLADQDNIWYKGKIDRVVSVFEKKKCAVVVHDCRVTDGKKMVMHRSYYKLRRCASGAITNIWKNHYVGCCMAFDSEKLKKIILPIPDNIHMHDQWIGILGDLNGGSVFINDVLLDFCRHGANNSEIDKHSDIKTMLRNRVVFVKEIWKRMGR